jgi:hypothetical protein
MTTFTNGPADGQILMISRAPHFLRVVESAGEFDALDQLDDKPTPEEAIHVYEIVGQPGMAFVDGTDPKTGKRFGRRVCIATYNYVGEVSDARIRETEDWKAWCEGRQFSPPLSAP